jgi:hypothetical protein
MVAKSKSSFTMPRDDNVLGNHGLLQDILNQNINEMCNLKFFPEWAAL